MSFYNLADDQLVNCLGPSEGFEANLGSDDHDHIFLEDLLKNFHFVYLFELALSHS